jgi:hypothetical protein
MQVEFAVLSSHIYWLRRTIPTRQFLVAGVVQIHRGHRTSHGIAVATDRPAGSGFVVMRLGDGLGFEILATRDAKPAALRVTSC